MIARKLLSLGGDTHPARMHNWLKPSLSVTGFILTELMIMSTPLEISKLYF